MASGITSKNEEKICTDNPIKYYCNNKKILSYGIKCKSLKYLLPLPPPPPPLIFKLSYFLPLKKRNPQKKYIYVCVFFLFVLFSLPLVNKVFYIHFTHISPVFTFMMLLRFMGRKVFWNSLNCKLPWAVQPTTKFLLVKNSNYIKSNV